MNWCRTYYLFLKQAMDDPITFDHRPDALTLSQAAYYQDLLYRVIKIGTEVEFALPKGVKRADFQKTIEKMLDPSRDMNRLGRLGIYDVVKEHSGIEIQVIGRHPQWDALLSQYRQIMTLLFEQGVRMRPTCGLHFHMLGIGLAEPVPEIILANFWNMARLFAPGLKYLTSAGESRETMCRRRQHNAHQEFMALSPGTMSLGEIQTRLKESRMVPEHQNFFNLEHLRFGPDGSILDFHVELRFPDGDLTPISVTAKTFLFFVMLLKAVEISKFGLIRDDHPATLERKLRLMNMISNNDGKLAASDTSGITDGLLDEYRDNGAALLRFLKSVFIIIDNPAEVVLQALVDKPVSVRRSQGANWLDIEAELSFVIPQHDYDEQDLELVKIIELGLIDACDTLETWLKKVAARSGLSVKIVRHRLEGYKNRQPVWNRELGRVVFKK